MVAAGVRIAPSVIMDGASVTQAAKADPRGERLMTAGSVFFQVRKLRAVQLQGKLSRSVACTASAACVDAIRCTAAEAIFTTSLLPLVVGAALASVDQVSRDGSLRTRHQECARRLKERLRADRLPVMGNDTNIVPLLVGDPVLAKAATDRLMQRHGIYIQPINYPTVPKGAERLRIMPSPYHGDDLMDALVGALDETWVALGIARAPRGADALAVA